MEFRIEFDKSIGLMVIFQSGVRDAISAGQNSGIVARSFREYQPRCVLLRLDRAEWSMTLSQWRHHVEDQLRIAPKKTPLAIAPATAIPLDMRLILSDRIEEAGNRIELFDTVDGAVAWLVAESGARRKQAC